MRRTRTVCWNLPFFRPAIPKYRPATMARERIGTGGTAKERPEYVGVCLPTVIAHRSRYAPPPRVRSDARRLGEMPRAPGRGGQDRQRDQADHRVRVVSR